MANKKIQGAVYIDATNEASLNGLSIKFNDTNIYPLYIEDISSNATFAFEIDGNAESSAFYELVIPADSGTLATREWVQQNSSKSPDFMSLRKAAIIPNTNGYDFSEGVPIQILTKTNHSKSFCSKYTENSITLKGNQRYGIKQGNRIIKHSITLTENKYSYPTLLAGLLTNSASERLIDIIESDVVSYDDNFWCNDTTQDLSYTYDYYSEIFDESVSDNYYSGLMGGQYINSNIYVIFFKCNASASGSNNYNDFYNDFTNTVLGFIDSELQINHGKKPWYQTFNENKLGKLANRQISMLKYRTRVMIKYVKDFNYRVEDQGSSGWVGQMSDYWTELQIGFLSLLTDSGTTITTCLAFHFINKKFN